MPDKFAAEQQRLLITMCLLKNVEDSDYTEKHSLRVGRLTKRICEELHIAKPECMIYTRSAYFHDVGKIKLSKKVLFMATTLSDEAFEEMKTHPKYSNEILIYFGLPEEAELALQHHERLDGSGYPKGLVGDEIKLGARIIAVADVYDAITSDRPYRRGFGIKEALLYLYSNVGNHYDGDVVKALHKALEHDKKLKNSLDI